jgi:hypothetical protein
MVARLIRVLSFLAAFGCASASDRIDPHAPGDRCLYSCPEGMACAGTFFGRGRTKPGQCGLTPGRCMATADCRPRELCIRPGPSVGVCKPENLL